MKKLSLLVVIIVFTQLSCTKDDFPLASELKFKLDNQEHTFYTFRSNFSIEEKDNGLKEVMISIHAEEVSILLRYTSNEVEGTYTNSNTIAGEQINDIYFCYDKEAPYCFTSSKCGNLPFVFTVKPHPFDSYIISGTFEGKVCKSDGSELDITNGAFENVTHVRINAR